MSEFGAINWTRLARARAVVFGAPGAGRNQLARRRQPQDVARRQNRARYSDRSMGRRLEWSG
jgi:hypothetical protein